MSAPIVAIVGEANSGKTTFLEKLIAELVRRGVRVAAVKHNRRGFEIDRPGKDSWRMREAGASAVVMVSVDQLAIIKETEDEVELEDAVTLLGDEHDLILVEGYKRGAFPKVEIFRHEADKKLISAGDEHLLAVVTDATPETSAPLYDLNDAKGVADLIESAFLRVKA